jgi:hypothetical protein
LNCKTPLAEVILVMGVFRFDMIPFVPYLTFCEGGDV